MNRNLLVMVLFPLLILSGRCHADVSPTAASSNPPEMASSQASTPSEIWNPRGLLGKDVSFALSDPELRSRLTKVLGSDFDHFFRNMANSASIKSQGKYLTAYGTLAPQNGSEKAAFSIDRYSGAVTASMFTGGLMKVYGVPHDYDLPQPLQEWYQNGGNPVIEEYAGSGIVPSGPLASNDTNQSVPLETASKGSSHRTKKAASPRPVDRQAENDHPPQSPTQDAPASNSTEVATIFRVLQEKYQSYILSCGENSVLCLGYRGVLSCVFAGIAIAALAVEVACGILGLGTALWILSAAGRKSDRRFKNGYKNNAEPTPMMPFFNGFVRTIKYGVGAGLVVAVIPLGVLAAITYGAYYLRREYWGSPSE